MRTPLVFTLPALTAVAFSSIAIAHAYDQSNLPYSDAPTDRPTAIAISTLTDMGILEGDPGGTIRPRAELNRAEFMKIVMSLLPDHDTASYSLRCFPDVPSGVWYESFVCHAKAAGILTGNAKPGLTPDQYPFEANRPVQYEEAVKVLVKLYALAIDNGGGQWYEPYLRAAEQLEINLSGLAPGDKIKRGEMARLVVGFVAYNDDSLDELRDTEEGIVSSSSSSEGSVTSATGSSVSSKSSTSSTSSRSSGSSRSSTSSVSSASSSWKSGYDASTDTAIRSQVLPLGTANSAILGAVNLFSNNEPLDVTKLRITLVDSSSAVDSFLVYDQTRRLLGRATLDSSVSGNKQYLVNLPQGTLTLPQRQNMLIYVRAALKSFDLGGGSNQSIQIASFTIEGNGEFSDSQYSQTYNDTFPTFLTARALITKVENAGATSGNFTTGSNQRLASFRFTGEGDSQGLTNLRVTSLSLQISAPSGVTLSNVYVKKEGDTDQSTCTISSNVITCISLPPEIGTVNNSTVIQVYGSVAADNGGGNNTLMLTLNDAGTASSAGSVTWTDGLATFTWVNGDSPLARGTQFQ